MTYFEIRECTDPACHLRMPIEPEINCGYFCPRCGAPMTLVEPAFQNLAPEQPLRVPRRRCMVILDNLRSAYNVGSIFRTADGVGVKHIYLCGISPTPATNSRLAKTALNAERTTAWTSIPNALTLVKDLKKRDYHLLALERTPQSIEIDQYRLDPADQRMIALIVGNERAGVDPGILRVCDAVLSLPMAGDKGSLNVAVAFGAAVYGLLWMQG